MSLDLSWSLLDADLANTLLRSLNSALQSAKRPDFLGPIVLESFHFGSEAPDVELVGVEDVWTEFLNADGEDGVHPAGAARDSTPASGTTSARMSPSNTRADAPGAGPSFGGLQGTMHRNDPRDDHLARFAEASLPFGGDQPGHGGAHPARLHTFRQYSPSDIQSVHFPRAPGGAGGAANGNWEAESVASFPMSGWMTPSIAGAPTTPWTGAAGLRAAAAGSASGAGGGAGGSLPGGNAGGGPAGPGGYFAPWQAHAAFLPAPHHRHPVHGPGAAAWRRKSHGRHLGHGHVAGDPSRRSSDDLHDPLGSGGGEGQAGGGASGGGVPSLQLRFSVLWSTTSLRLTLSTSLLINHPSPGFMSLPLTITLTGLALQCGLVVAFENDEREPSGAGAKRRVHLSLVEDEYDEEEEDETPESHDESQDAQLDEDGEPVVGPGPSGLNLAGINGASNGNGAAVRRRSSAYTPHNPSPLGSAGGPHPFPTHSRTSSTANLNGGARRGGGRDPLRPAPSVGERLLPHLSLESSVGQADKHVLRNVGKVERFVMELIRKAVVNELVFPNFYSVDIER